MSYKQRISGVFLLTIIAFAGFACQTQTTTTGNGGGSGGAPVVKAQSPTEAYKMLFAACKAKNIDQIKQLMSRGSLGLAQFSAAQKKESIEKVLENGLLAPTIEPALTEIRDERVNGNFGRIEVRNERENRWEDLPFVLEDGGWKVAVGDIFQGAFDPQQTLPKGKGQNDLPGGMMPTNSADAPVKPGSNSKKTAAPPREPKSIEVPKDDPKK